MYLSDLLRLRLLMTVDAWTDLWKWAIAVHVVTTQEHQDVTSSGQGEWWPGNEEGAFDLGLQPGTREVHQELRRPHCVAVAPPADSMEKRDQSTDDPPKSSGKK